MPPAALIAIAALGAVVSAVGAIQQGNAAQKAANAQANFQRQQAENERKTAELKAADFRRQTSARAAISRAAEGASGLQIGTGSSLLVAEDFATQSDIQANRIILSGELGATSLETEAGFTEFAGSTAKRASRFRAGASLLQGASALGGSFGAGTNTRNVSTTISGGNQSLLPAVRTVF